MNASAELRAHCGTLACPSFAIGQRRSCSGRRVACGVAQRCVSGERVEHLSNAAGDTVGSDHRVAAVHSPALVAKRCWRCWLKVRAADCADRTAAGFTSLRSHQISLDWYPERYPAAADSVFMRPPGRCGWDNDPLRHAHGEQTSQPSSPDRSARTGPAAHAAHGHDAPQPTTKSPAHRAARQQP